MKRLFYSIVLLSCLSLCTSAIAASTELIGSSLRLTNVLGNGYSLLDSVGNLTLYGPAGGPSIGLTHTGTPGWTEQLAVGNNSFTISGAPVGGGAAVPIYLIGNVSVTGNLTASGTVTGSGLVFSVTNFTYATNALYATNDQNGILLVNTNMFYTDTNMFKEAQAYYPTNSQTEDTDMRIPYGDVVFAPNFFWNYVVGRSTTNYQTAVRFLRASPERTGGTNFLFPNNVKAVGNPWITNLTVCTWIYNPSVPETNLLILPIW